MVKGGRAKLFNPQIVCQAWLKMCYQTDYKELKTEDDVERILFDKPIELRNDDFIDGLYDEIQTTHESRETVKFLQLADLHIDLQYQINSMKKDCGDWLMCC